MSRLLILTALTALGAAGCARHTPAGSAAASASGSGLKAPGNAPPRCLVDGGGYLRLRARGALTLDIDWHGAGLACEGGPRPDHQGLRLTFAAEDVTGTHRPRLVIGAAAQPGAGTQHAVPANVTLILEGEDRLFSTRGDEKCTIDELVQTPLSAAPNPGGAASTPAYRVSGRGFCAEPATSIDGRENVLISRFDFAGRAVDAEPEDHPK